VFILLVKTAGRVLDINATHYEFVHTKRIIKHMFTPNNAMGLSVGIDEMKHKVADNN
jgi:hypothetical protein